jgi:hypothetical protein
MPRLPGIPWTAPRSMKVLAGFNAMVNPLLICPVAAPVGNLGYARICREVIMQTTIDTARAFATYRVKIILPRCKGECSDRALRSLSSAIDLPNERGPRPLVYRAG